MVVVSPLSGSPLSSPLYMRLSWKTVNENAAVSLREFYLYFTSYVVKIYIIQLHNTVKVEKKMK